MAGQLNHCMQHLDYFTPVLLGFNPITLARDNPIDGWDKTFRQTAQQMQQLQEDAKAFVLNPVVGVSVWKCQWRLVGVFLWWGLMARSADRRTCATQGGCLRGMCPPQKLRNFEKSDFK